MPRVDDADFLKWLEFESRIPADETALRRGCQSCGVAEGVYPFMRGHCVVCLSYQYGQFVKSQEIAMWIDRHLWLLARGEINDKASAIRRLGNEYPLPRADETDEEFAEHCESFAASRR